jgi:hypothetical protein
MVDWFSPVELGRTGIRALLAEVFGSYADKRELQAALHQSTDTPFTTPCARRVPECTEMWLDYVADVGDGFNTTFSVAWLLSRDELEVEGVSQPTPRADVLVLGGDQVYPSATRDTYRDRMAGPYAAALPAVSGHVPVLFAIPGNHDWYDGLTSFTRQFCQRRTIGAWQTEQFRSYFAAKLIRNWWIWGIDIQLGSDIDYPQLRYFRDIAQKMEEDANARTSAGDPPLRVILVTAQPSWVTSDATRDERRGVIGADPADFRALAFFLDEVIYCADENRRRRIEVAVVLSGDLHHYAHYARSDEKPSSLPRHLITAGSGGAYTTATHHLRERLMLLDHEGRDTSYRLQARYPDAKQSSRLARRVYILPFASPTFTLLVGLVYLFLMWQLQLLSQLENGRSMVEQMLAAPARAVTIYATTLLRTPAMWAWIVTLATLLVMFCPAASNRRKTMSGVAHTVVHVVLLGVVLAISAWLLGPGWAETYYTPWQGWIPLRPFLFGIMTALLGGLIGTWGCALYLDWMAHRCKGALHMNDVFAAQRCEQYKCFLRMKLDERGLTISALKCPTFPGRWKARVTGSEVSPRATLWPADAGSLGSRLASIRTLVRPLYETSWGQRLLKRGSWIRIEEAAADERPPSRARVEVADVITIRDL